jgi:hypothetical protein
MHESKSNSWMHGPARFKPPALPGGLAIPDGLVPVPAIINLEVGEEIVLYLKDSTAFINTLAKTRPFDLRVHGGVARNQHGCLGFFVFWVPSPFNPLVPLVIYDIYLNLRSETHLGWWRELAFQTHWHLVLLDRKNEQRNFFEFVNTFRIDVFLDEMQRYCEGIEVLDFDKTKAEFMATKSVEDLFDAGPTSSSTSESGLSLYDSRFAVPQPPENANPLKRARYVKVVRESVAQHSIGERIPAAIYLDGKLKALQSKVAKRRVIYLDVCHWINLRHVWLQSSKALPIYEQIVDCLNRLALQQTVLCPLSAPIFEELMKQLDPRSRAATANLMDIFSQGISMMRFEEAFAQQCCTAIPRDGAEVRVNSSSFSKVGMWFGDEMAKAAWWTPEISDMWDNVSIDLRWETTVNDCQKLTIQGFPPQLEARSFFTKWTDLASQQKSQPKPFWELSRRCRSDVVDEYLVQVVANVVAILGGVPPGEINANVLRVARSMVDSRGYGLIPCCEVIAGMCAAQVFRGGKLRPNDIFDFLHASAGIPASEAYFCDGPMEHLLRSKHLKLDEEFKVRIHSDPEDLLSYLKSLES